MTSPTLRARRGSALILVLLMTLAVAGLAVAAIFLSSSAGLLSRFYDREREFRFAAESALEQIRSRLAVDSAYAIPDTGVVQLLAGHAIADADGTPIPRVSVNVYAALTGDTTGRSLPHVTLIAAAYDANGTRHVRRTDLRRESFSRYSLFADQFGGSLSFNNGTVQGRVHTNETWRSGAAAEYLDTVSAVVGLSGSPAYEGDTVSGWARITFPVDSTYPRLDSLALAANLSFAPVNASGSGWRTGTRLEFVTVDADGDSILDADEGFVRVFDLTNGHDTTRLSVGLPPTDYWGLWTGLAKRWDDPVVQNQCGAFYLRLGRWHFIPVATHRANWAKNLIGAVAGGNYPSSGSPGVENMDEPDYWSTSQVLQQPTARCFPAGSPFLVSTERMTNQFGVVTGGVADTIPFGVVTPGGGWPANAPYGYGGSDTTFTPRSRTCVISTSGNSGRCDNGTISTLGTWRAFGGTAVTGVPVGIRQANELPFLWPFSPPRNSASRRVVRASSGPLFVSGVVRGDVTLHVDGSVRIIERLRQATDPADPAAVACDNQLGVLAVGDILVADNALTRGRRIVRGNLWFSDFTRQLGPDSDVAVHAHLMSVTGTVGAENASTGGIVPRACPQDGPNNTSGGCLRIVGGMAMRTFSQLHGGGSSGLRYGGVKDPCQATTRRPPFFPLTNRYTFIRTLEVAPTLGNTPVKIRNLLLRLKGVPL